MRKARVFKAWLPFAILSLGFVGFTYAAMQQNYRQTANDPQIQMAQDIRLALMSGAKPDTLIPAEKVQLGDQAAPFVMIFDAQKHLVATNLMDTSVLPPSGSLEAAQNQENRITWQPTASAREAAVIRYYSSTEGQGYVLVARDLNETEKRIEKLGAMAFITLILALGLTYLAVYVNTEA